MVGVGVAGRGVSVGVDVVDNDVGVRVEDMAVGVIVKGITAVLEGSSFCIVHAVNKPTSKSPEKICVRRLFMALDVDNLVGNQISQLFFIGKIIISTSLSMNIRLR